MSTDYTLEGGVQVTRANGIAHIEFHHPQSNSLPSRVLAALAQAITDEGTHPDSRVIVLRSAGDRVFCGGASFDELATIRTEEEGLHFFGGFASVINALRTCPKLTIGRVQGKAVGGGVGLASAVDYCLATQHAAVKLSELAVGIGPFVVGPAVARKMGLSAMSQLAIDATQFKSAEWAQQQGLYAEVYSRRRRPGCRGGAPGKHPHTAERRRPNGAEESPLGGHRKLGPAPGRTRGDFRRPRAHPRKSSRHSGDPPVIID